MSAVYYLKLEKKLEGKHSKELIRNIVSYVGSNPTRFSELLKGIGHGPQRKRMGLSWAMSYCVENHPNLLTKHFNELIKLTSEESISTPIKRNCIRALQFVTIPIRYQGLVVTLCFQLLNTRTETVAIRVYAMTVLANLVGQNPELRREVVQSIEDGLMYAQPAYLSRAKKVLKELRNV
jgi:hypothetical protein